MYATFLNKNCHVLPSILPGYKALLYPVFSCSLVCNFKYQMYCKTKITELRRIAHLKDTDNRKHVISSRYTQLVQTNPSEKYSVLYSYG